MINITVVIDLMYEKNKNEKLEKICLSSLCLSKI